MGDAVNAVVGDAVNAVRGNVRCHWEMPFARDEGGSVFGWCKKQTE